MAPLGTATRRRPMTSSELCARTRRVRAALWGMCALAVNFAAADAEEAAKPSSAPLAFPGAMGWAAHTPGGRGGKILRVTTLDAGGPGSFVEALETKGPRIVVFEVGGVIDLGK